MTNKQVYELVERYARDLGEHVDAVQILVTWNEEGLTKDFACGSGNWYARQGLAHEFISQNQSQSIAQEMSKVSLHVERSPEDDESAA